MRGFVLYILTLPLVMWSVAAQGVDQNVEAESQENRRAAMFNRIYAEEAMLQLDVAMHFDEMERVTPEESLRDYRGFSLRTNLLYWMGATPNIGVEYRASRGCMGYILNGGYAPFTDPSWEYNIGGWFVAPEVRFYMGRKSNGFLGLMLLATDYNVKVTDTGYQGCAYGAGVTGGYKFYLSPKFDMDLSLGVIYGKAEYDSYKHHDNGTNTFYSRNVVKERVMPAHAGLSLIWKIRSHE